MEKNKVVKILFFFCQNPKKKGKLVYVFPLILKEVIERALSMEFRKLLKLHILYIYFY